MPAPVVVYANFESAIDEKNRHKPIMLSCLAVSHIPTIDNQLKIFHAPHESEKDLQSFINYLIILHETVKRYLFDELQLETSDFVDRNYLRTTECPFCFEELTDSTKVRHHVHVAGE